MEKEILTLEEASQLFQVTPKTLLKTLKEEKVPARKIGREWRFSRQALMDWLRTGDSRDYSLAEVQVKDYFNQIAPQWEHMKDEYFGESVKRRLLETVPLGKEWQVIDVGTGSGYLARAIAPRVKKVIAVDNSELMLKEAARIAKLEGISNIKFLEGDGYELPVSDNASELVLANMFLHHLEDPAIAIQEMARVLKPGGTLVVTDLFQHSNEWMREEMADIWLGFTAEEVACWMQDAGLIEAKVEALDCRCCGQSSCGKAAAIEIFMASSKKPAQACQCG